MTSFGSFGATLDDKYVDLVFDKLASYEDEDVKEKKINEAKDFLANPWDEGNTGLESLYVSITKDKKDQMEKYGISKSDVRRNIDALKEWSIEDRKALIEAGASGDKPAVEALNDKYSNKSSDSKGSSSGGSNGSSGGGGSSATASKETIVPVVEEVQEQTGKAIKEKLMAKGLLSEEKEIKASLKDKQFKDMTNHWANEDVVFLAKRGIVNGNEDGTYNPNANVTKAEALTLVLNMIVEDTEKIAVSDDLAEDVATDKWYVGNIQQAEALKLVSRSMDNRMSPESVLTRGEVVKILVNTVKVMEIPLEDTLMEEPAAFTDFNTLNPSTKEALTIGVNLGFINGLGDGTIAADQPVTRGQMAAFMKRLYNYLMNTIK